MLISRNRLWESLKRMPGFRYTKYGQNYAPKNVAPGTLKLDWFRMSGRAGRMEQSKVVYDAFGRQVSRLDLSNNMRPLDISLRICIYMNIIGTSLVERKRSLMFGNMENIKKIDLVYEKWNPSDIAFIKAVEWLDGNVKLVCYCQPRQGIKGWPDTTKDFWELSILFSEVSQLRLNFSEHVLCQVLGLEISDISENDWQNLNFEVQDSENGRISFFCKEITMLECRISDL